MYISTLFVQYQNELLFDKELLHHHNQDVWTVKDYDEKQEYMDEHGYKVGDIKKTHDYFVVDFHNPRYRNTIAKELNIDSRFVHKVINYRSAMEYAIHYNKSDKHAYSIDECFGTLKLDLRKFVQGHVFDEEKSQEIVDLICDSPAMNLKQLITEINKRGLYSIFIRGYSMYRDLLCEHNMGVY